MAKIYRFYNDAKTIDAEYISDGMTNHETLFLTELRSVGSAEVQAGLNLGVEPITESVIKDLAKTLLLNLEITNDGTQISDLKGGAFFETFTFAEQSAAASIDADLKTVAIEVVALTDPSALVATFTTSDEVASVLIGEVAQESGTTENDFSSAVEYIVTSEAGEAVTWTVTVTVAA